MKIKQLLHRFNIASYTFFYLGAYLKITSQTIDTLQKITPMIHAIAHLLP